MTKEQIELLLIADLFENKAKELLTKAYPNTYYDEARFQKDLLRIKETNWKEVAQVYIDKNPR